MEIASYRNINIENPQTQPKEASTAYSAGMWIAFAGDGFVEPAVGNTTLGTQNMSPDTIEGLNLTAIPDTDTTNDLLTYDGIDDTVDRFVMPVVPTDTITYGTLVGGPFTAGETITGSTSGATAVISTDNASNTMVVNTITGTFLVGEIITGTDSGATAHILTIGITTYPNAVLFNGSKHNVGPDSISLDGSVAGTQFQVTKVINGDTAFPSVEVRVLLDNN